MTQAELLSIYKEVQMVDSTAAANSLLKDGWRLICVGVDVMPTGDGFGYLLGRKFTEQSMGLAAEQSFKRTERMICDPEPIIESVRIATDLKYTPKLRRRVEWDCEGEPKRTHKLSRMIGRLITELKTGREIRLTRENGQRLDVCVYQDGKCNESYTPCILNDLPSPTEEFSDRPFEG